MMKNIKDVRSATQGIAAVLLFGIAFSANADVMKAMPAPVVTQTLVAPAVPSATTPITPNTTISPKSPAPSGGVMLFSPAAACVSNNTPRIGNVNGTQSGIEFKPGDTLNISGCGFGNKGGVVLLNNLQAPLIINKWSDANIIAKIDPMLSKYFDASQVKLTVTPNGSNQITSLVTYKFRAAREDTLVKVLWGLSNQDPEVAEDSSTYSKIYGNPSIHYAADDKSTIVERNLIVRRDGGGFCPPVTNQENEMKDFWQIYVLPENVNAGFEAVELVYQNNTDPDSTDNDDVQNVLVGNAGGASVQKVGRTNGVQVPKRVAVTFQGHSRYHKKGALGVGGGYSECTSKYSVSLRVRGPRGIPYF